MKPKLDQRLALVAPGGPSRAIVVEERGERRGGRTGASVRTQAKIQVEGMSFPAAQNAPHCRHDAVEEAAGARIQLADQLCPVVDRRAGPRGPRRSPALVRRTCPVRRARRGGSGSGTCRDRRDRVSSIARPRTPRSTTSATPSARRRTAPRRGSDRGSTACRRGRPRDRGTAGWPGRRSRESRRRATACKSHAPRAASGRGDGPTRRDRRSWAGCSSAGRAGSLPRENGSRRGPAPGHRAPRASRGPRTPRPSRVRPWSRWRTG